MATHAIITPWPLSQGVRTWCGFDAGDGRVSQHLVATTPGAVDCEKCISAMRQAYANLGKWMPDLGTDRP